MFLLSFLAYLYWNPERIAFTIPIIDRPVAWYGLCFVFGFTVGYFILLPLFRAHLIKASKSPQAAFSLLDRFTWYAVGGTIIGARLGHVFFYDWPYYQENPISILYIWNGGLASHGATLGILIALFLYQRSISKNFPEFSLIAIFDMIVIPTAFIAGCIRVGNFINQEVLGIPSTLPWAVTFGHPLDGSPVVPRHPVQLYEAIIYFATFALLFWIRKQRDGHLKPGLMSGLFLTLVFGSRFFVEFLKMPQGFVINETFLQTGQYLSIPFILFGLYLLSRKPKMSSLECGSPNESTLN